MHIDKDRQGFVREIYCKISIQKIRFCIQVYPSLIKREIYMLVDYPINVSIYCVFGQKAKNSCIKNEPMITFQTLE